MSPLHRIIRQYGPYRISLGPAKLFLDDIQDIVSTIEAFGIARIKNMAIATDSGKPFESGDAEAVAIVATDRIADEVADLREASREELKHLYISLNAARLFVDLSHIGSSISVPRDDTDARALAEDLAKFINSKRMRSYANWILRGGSLYFLIGVAGNITLGFYGLIHHTAYFPSFVTAAIDIAFVMGLATFVAPSKLREVRIVAMKRSERRWFSGINRREITIAVIASAIGAFIIGIAGLWAGVFNK